VQKAGVRRKRNRTERGREKALGEGRATSIFLIHSKVRSQRLEKGRANGTEQWRGEARWAADSFETGEADDGDTREEADQTKEVAYYSGV